MNQGACPKRWYNPFGFDLGQLVARQACHEILRRKLVRLITRKRGLRADLARHCRVSPSQVGRWAEGTDLPTYDRLDDIAAFFGVTVPWLFSPDGDAVEAELDYETAYRILGRLLPKNPKK